MRIFLIDVAGLFRSAGHDVESVYSESIQGCSDKQLIMKCREESRALVTLDNDFSDIITYPPDTTEGIIVLRAKEQGRKLC